MTFLARQSCRRCLPLLARESQSCAPSGPQKSVCAPLPFFNQIFSRSMFYQEDRHGPGYGQDERREKPLGEIERLKENFENVKKGWKMLPGEWEKFKQEQKINLQIGKPINIGWDYPDGCFQKEFVFRGAESLDNWIVSTDRDWGEGFTKAELTVSKNNMALFQGHLCTDLPVDGFVKQAGYANMKSMDKVKSFRREDTFHWDNFTHFIARVRGDGRTYVICLHTPGWCDMLWNDTYHFFLYTRGGPYWQFVKIPFSRFLFGAKGAVQDFQFPIDNTHNVRGALESTVPVSTLVERANQANRANQASFAVTADGNS